MSIPALEMSTYQMIMEVQNSSKTKTTLVISKGVTSQHDKAPSQRMDKKDNHYNGESISNIFKLMNS